jgi:2-polyprenyl-3-methyl-5-hydroxy-6-metoxy-1,4-benzoquinol methylase
MLGRALCRIDVINRLTPHLEGAVSCCRHCEDASDLFNKRAARRDLRRYRSRGPSRTTRFLLEALLAQRGGDQTLLDVGGGVGAIPHELLSAGFSRAVHVDASAAYLAASEQEAERRGLRGRIDYHHGDFVELAPNVAAADVVTLDRVICCYPDVERLVATSAEKAQHLYGIVFPRERIITCAGTALANTWFRLRRSAFRTYLHPTTQVEAILYRCGFRRTSFTFSFLWQVATYERA